MSFPKNEIGFLVLGSVVRQVLVPQVVILYLLMSKISPQKRRKSHLLYFKLKQLYIMLPKTIRTDVNATQASRDASSHRKGTKVHDLITMLFMLLFCWGIGAPHDRYLV